MKLHANVVATAFLVVSTVKEAAAAAANDAPSYGLVGVYKDDACSSADIYGLTIGPAGSCASAKCSNRQTVSCSNDLQAVVKSVCGTKPFVQALQYADDKCSTLMGGVVVPIDGQCHAMNDRFFKATLNVDNTVAASVFSDANCTNDLQNAVISSDNVGKCVGAWLLNVVNQKLGKGQFTVMSYYADDKCATPPLIVSLPATNIMASGYCVNTQCKHRVTTQCTPNPVSTVGTAVAGMKQYVRTQTFGDTKACNKDTLMSDIVVPIDGVCRPMLAQFLIATLNADNTVTLGGYKDSTCKTLSGGPPTLLTSANVGVCRPDSAMFSVVGVTLGNGPVASLVAYYKDDKCTTIESYEVRSGPAESCKNSTCSGRQSVICTDDVQSRFNSAWGTKPFMQALHYADDKCTQLVDGGAGPIDGLCHVLNGTSYKNVLNADNTVKTASYSDSKCTNEVLATVISSDNAGQCMGRWKLNVANQKLGKGPYAVMSMYADDKCATPPIVAALPASSVLPGGVCKNATCVGRVSTLCTQNPVKALATVTSGIKQYVTVQGFADAKTGSSASIVSSTIVPIDGVCHALLGGYVVATLNSDKTVTLGGYKESTCKTLSGGPPMLLTSDMVNTCRPDGGMFSVTGVALGKGAPTPAPVPMTFAIKGFFSDAKCSGTPGLMMVSPVATTKCTSVVCTSQGSSTCADDARKAVASAFGAKPYVSLTSFADNKCTTVSFITVVMLDGVCRAAGGMFVKAAQNADLSVTVSYFSECLTTLLPAVKVTKDTVDTCAGNTVASVTNAKLGK